MIEIKLAAVKDTKLHEYLMRFLFGGAATVAAGLIAQRFGAGIGGLFLAFPAIFPAGVTLLEKHEKQRKAKIGAMERAEGAWPPALIPRAQPSAAWNYLALHWCCGCCCRG